MIQAETSINWSPRKRRSDRRFEQHGLSLNSPYVKQKVEQGVEWGERKQLWEESRGTKKEVTYCFRRNIPEKETLLE